MEKLIKLLNESTNGRFDSKQDLMVCVEFRGYCRNFVKRLVDNDKIDTRKLENYIDFHNDYKFVANRELKDKYPNGIYTDHLLMLLSIQDNPISFLTSILK